jgi:tripartite-type tricarboxylate transporter receptor subunit TctC
MKSAGLAAFMAALMLLNGVSAMAQSSATRTPVRIVTIGPAGGSLDLIARTLAQDFPEFTGQPATVDNKPGASGNIGARDVARSKPDGSTIGIITNGTHGVNVALFGNDLPYDPIEDFAPISLLLVIKFVLVVNPDLPVANVREFVAYAKANPEKVSFASAGPGSAMHIAGELFSSVADVKMTHVAYVGTAKALSMLMANEVQAMFAPIAESMEHIQSGRIRVLATTSKERSDSLPHLATIGEQGFPDYDFAAWIALAAPKGTSAEIVDRYNGAVGKILTKADVKVRLKNIGMEARTSTPGELSARIRAEVAKWPPIVKAAGIKAQ